MTEYEHDELPRPEPPPGEPRCRQCGCWEWDACWIEPDWDRPDEDTWEGPCWWAEDDLCSACAMRGGRQLQPPSPFSNAVTQ